MIIKYKVKQDTQIRENTIYNNEVYIKSNDIHDFNFNVIGYELYKEQSLIPKVLYLYLNEVASHFEITN